MLHFKAIGVQRLKEGWKICLRDTSVAWRCVEEIVIFQNGKALGSERGARSNVQSQSRRLDNFRVGLLV